jgi:hypothetical protein
MVDPLAPAPPSRDPLLRLLGAALAEIAAAAALVRAEGAFFVEHNLSRPVPGGTNALGPAEASFFLAHVVAGIPAALLLTDAATRLLGGRAAPWAVRVLSRPRLMALVCALSAAALTVLISGAVLDRMPLTGEETVILAQARALLTGSFSSPSPGSHAAFPFERMIDVPPNRWAGALPPGQPLLVMLGMLIARTPFLWQPFFVGGTVYCAARLASELWDAETSVVASLLLCSSPLLLVDAATLVREVPTMFFCLVAVRATYRSLRSGHTRHDAIVGGALGAAFLCSPYDTIAVAIPLAAVLLRAAIRPVTPSTPARGTAGLAWLVASALPAILLSLVANSATTGNAFVTGHARWLEQMHPGARTVGIGPTITGGMHTIQLMFSKALVTLVRLSTWAFGWPVSLWPLLALLLGVGRDSRSRLLLAVLGVHFAAACLRTTNGASELGTPGHLAELPFIALLSARALVALGEHLRRFGERLSLWPGRLALACSLIGLFTFWPAEIGWAWQSGQHTREPLAVATTAVRGQPALVFWQEPASTGAGHASFAGNDSFHPPVPGPQLNDPILWARDLGPENGTTIARYTMRRPFRLTWSPEGQPQVTALDDEPKRAAPTPSAAIMVPPR